MQYFAVFVRCYDERTEKDMLINAQKAEDPDRERIDSLLSRIKDGDRHAMELLYRCTAKNVYGYALSMLKSTVDAEDVLHDCYVQVFQKARFYRSEGKPMAWILTIVKNLCRDAMRKRKKTDPLPDGEWVAELAEQKHLSSDERLLLDECMKRLSDEERMIIVQHAVIGFKHQEIADDLDLPLSTVLSKYRRALMKLRTAMLKGDSYDV